MAEPKDLAGYTFFCQWQIAGGYGLELMDPSGRTVEAHLGLPVHQATEIERGWRARGATWNYSRERGGVAL